METIWNRSQQEFHISLIRLSAARSSPGLEWVSNGEMDALPVTERRNVEITRLAGIVWCVDANAPIDAYDKEVKVIAQTQSRA